MGLRTFHSFLSSSGTLENPSLSVSLNHRLLGDLELCLVDSDCGHLLARISNHSAHGFSPHGQQAKPKTGEISGQDAFLIKATEKILAGSAPVCLEGLQLMMARWVPEENEESEIVQHGWEGGTA